MDTYNTILATNLIHLNVGGRLFVTTKTTLLREPDSYFSRMMSHRFSLTTTADGSIFIDRDYELFAVILHYLRTNTVMCDKADVRQRTALLEEAEYYGIQSLIDRLKIDNSCLEFDGVDDYVDLGVFPTLPVYTIEVWVKAHSAQHNYAGIIYFGGDDNTWGWGLGIKKKTSLFSRISYCDTDGNRLEDPFSVDYQPYFNRWAHVAVTDSGKERTMYINGEHVGSKFNDSHNSECSKQIGSIGVWGADRRSTNAYFKGKIRDVRVWGVVRNKQEISDNATALLDNQREGLLHHWPLFQDQGIEAVDTYAGCNAHLGPHQHKPKWCKL